MKRQAVTIYDVARAAGVAPSTVSRAFSRPGRVNSVTAQRIRTVAEELGYRVNPTARAPLPARTRTLAVVVSDVGNPFFAEVLRGAQDAAAQGGYTTLLVDAQESDVLERAAVEHILSMVDGVVLSGSRIPDSTIRLIASQKPLIVLNRVMVDVPSVVPDNAQGMRLIVEHLTGLGHRTIVYAAGPPASWADGMRWRTLLEECSRRSVGVGRLGPFRPDVAGGLEAAEHFLSRPGTAVVTYNDQMGVGLMRGLATAGVSVPGQVSVVGFDNIEISALVTPALTTVATPLQTAGATAARQLVALVEGLGLRRRQPTVLPVELVLRESTAVRTRKRISPASGTTRASSSDRQA